MTLVIGGLFVLVGLYMWTLGLREWQTRRHGVRAVGTVVGIFGEKQQRTWDAMNAKASKDGSNTQQALPNIPIIGFRTADGRDVRIHPRTIAIARHRIGESVTVYYDPGNPERCAVGESSNVTKALLFGLAFAAAGGMTLLLG